MDDSFEVQNLIKDTLTNYFNPVRNENDSGWEIGIVPKKTQIMMKLGTLKSHAMIYRTTMIASYVDGTGAHETDISDLKITPFMVVKSGEHKVIISYK